MSSVYLFEIGSQKAQWLSARQTAIAANVANANTPGYHAVDIQPFSAVLDSSPIELATTNPAHLSLPQSETGALREVEVDPAEQFDIDFAVMAGELAGLLGDLWRVLGKDAAGADGWPARSKVA